MKIQVKKRQKLELKLIPVGKSFRLINSEQCYLRMDVSKEVTLKPVLKDNTAYCVNLDTGVVSMYDLNLKVEEIFLRAEEDWPDEA